MNPFGNQGPYRRGIGSRIVTFLIVILIGIGFYMSQSQENPITGEKQHVSMTPNQEISLGLQAAPEMARKMGGELPSTDSRVQLTRQIGNKIVEQTEARKSPWKFQFHVLADQKTVNAFALPGGQIFITAGLYNKLQNEAQLAGVLSHEMGHVIERHTAEHMAKSQLGQMFVMAVGAASSDQRNSGYAPMVIASVVNQMFQLRYSRKDESEADVWGIKLMSKIGYDPYAMVDVMEILKASGPKGHLPEMFQTHPNPDLRIERIKEYLKEHPPSKGLTEGKRLQHS